MEQVNMSDVSEHTQGPGLSVRKRMVTGLTKSEFVSTVSRTGGSMRFLGPVADWITENV